MVSIHSHASRILRLQDRWVNIYYRKLTNILPFESKDGYYLDRRNIVLHLQAGLYQHCTFFIYQILQMSHAFHRWAWKMATYLTYPLLLLHVITNLVDQGEEDLIYNKTVMKGTKLVIALAIMTSFEKLVIL